MKKHKIDDLNKLYTDAYTADKLLFSEQRSNVLLASGEHYSKKQSRYFNRVRDSRALSQEQKLRLTKNHVQKITKTYKNQILSHAPGVTILPQNEDEAQDKKSAELNKAIWQDAIHKYDLKDKISSWVDDFIEIGECAVKITWNEDLGRQIGWAQAVDELGNPKHDPETGEPMQTNEAVMSGDFEFKRIFGFNLFRPTGVQNLADAEWLGERDMVPTSVVKSWVSDDESKMSKVTQDSEDNFYVFDNQSYGYEFKKDHTLVKSMYFKPSKQYPQGYFYIYTQGVILFEGELPYGIFPIVYRGFDAIQSNPRHRSIIKQLRPYQVEINRCASKMAEHQVTLGDDKILVQSGTKLTNGVALPGVRALQYSGREPVILQGRSGAQYLEYMMNQIEEMYQVANMPDEKQEKQMGQGGDAAFGALFMSMRQKKKFVLYAEKFERFLVDVCELFLNLARNYYDENTIVRAIGKNEFVNIAEFKSTEPNEYRIKAVPSNDDLETLYGKQLVMNHALQYVGNSLEKDDIGRFMKNMPFGNFDDSFKDMTIDHDSAENLILAIERGEQPQPNPYDNHTYMIKRLVGRVREPSFKMLPPQIQELFQGYIHFYEQLEVERQRTLLAAQSEYIPVDSPGVKVDVYVPKKGGDNPNAVERAVIPQSALEWLIQRLEDQGNSQERLKTMNQGAVQEMSGQLLMGQGGPGQGNRG